MITFDIKGTKELYKRLAETTDKIEKKIAMKAVRAGGSEYAKRVRKKIPKDGTPDDIHLKKSIAARGVKGRAAKNKIRVQVGVVGKARKYAHVYEWGGGKYKSGNKVFSTTLQSESQAILDKMADKMRMELDKL